MFICKGLNREVLITWTESFYPTIDFISNFQPHFIFWLHDEAGPTDHSLSEGRTFGCLCRVWGFIGPFSNSKSFEFGPLEYIYT